MRTPRRGPVALVLLLAAAFTAHDAGPIVRDGEALARAFDGVRPFRPRVTGGFRHTPWPHAERMTTPGGANLPVRARLALARSRQRSARRAADEGWVAKLHVLSVQGNEALAGLHIGAAVKDLTPETLTDLAAAALISSEVDDRPDRIPVALELALRASDRRPDLAEAHHNAALALEQLGLFRQAAAAWRMVRDTDPDAGWQSEALAGLERTSVVTDRQARVDMMLTALRDGRPLAPETARDADAARELVLRHALPAWSADVPYAATVRDASVAIAERTGDREPLHSVEHLTRECTASPARCHAATRAHQDHGAGVDAWDRERTRDAFAAFDRVRAAVPGDHPLLGSIDLMHARRDYYGGRFEQASARAMAVAADAAARGHVALQGRALWLAGLVAHERGWFEAALERYRDARDILAAAADHDGSIAVENLLANYYALLEDDIRTWRHLQAAARGLVDARPARRDPVLANGAIATAKAGLHRAALAFLEEAVAETRALGVPGPEAMALAGLAGGLSALERWDEADARLNEAAQRAEAVADGELRSIVQAVVAAAEGEALFERKPEASLAALTRAIEFYGGRDSVFDLARLLHLRGRVLLGQGRAAEAEADWLRGVELATSQYRALLASRDRALLRAVRWKLFTALADLYAVTEGAPERGLDVLEGARVALDSLRPHTSVAHLRSMTPAGTLLVTYAVRDDRTLGWAVDRDDAVSFIVPHGALEIRRQVERFRGLVQDGAAPDDARREAAALFETLLGPVRERVARATRLVIVPDGSLSVLPFSALRDDAGFLVERRAVVMSPSFAYALASDGDRTSFAGASGALVVGNPAARQADLADLPGAEREARLVAELFPGAGTALLQGGNATRRRFLEMLPGAPVVHFAGHARANLARPELSQLFLAPEDDESGAVFLHEIEALRLSATRLVVLAACESARGIPLDGEGVVGLARAFISAGVPAVVATLWQIDDLRSRPLFVDFHRALLGGADAPEALRQAQLSVLNGGADVPMAAWAAPVAIGRAR